MKTKLVIFGITGDLSRRKLLPAITHIVKEGEFEQLSIIGVSRREVDIPELVKESTGTGVLADRTSVFTMDLANAQDYVSLKDYVDLKEDEQALIYLSVPPSAATTIVDFLGQADFNSPRVKILFEKPFGFDYDSALDFIQRTGRYFDEKQLYRIDHYMAKEVAAEVIRLRSNAETHHHAWSRESVKSVEIIASESIGIEDRAIFYEQTGALRDFIQGHLMQLLALVLMDLSAPFTVDDLAERRLDALRSLKSVNLEDVYRAQYEGYGAEVENPGSTTETFMNIDLSSSDARWQGVQLRLTTGKSLDRKRSAIVVKYIDGAEDVFEEGAIPAKDGRLLDAYERVLIEAIRGRKHIFTSSEEILRSWELLAPVQEAWAMDKRPLPLYPVGASIATVLAKDSI